MVVVVVTEGEVAWEDMVVTERQDITVTALRLVQVETGVEEEMVDRGASVGPVGKEEGEEMEAMQVLEACVFYKPCHPNFSC